MTPMLVVCYCGQTFQLTGDHGDCPNCGETIDVPHRHQLERREIGAYLRAAVKGNLLEGWYWVGSGEHRRYILNTSGSGDCIIHAIPGIIAYCNMLADAGIRPLYRTT